MSQFGLSWSNFWFRKGFGSDAGQRSSEERDERLPSMRERGTEEREQEMGSTKQQSRGSASSGEGKVCGQQRVAASLRSARRLETSEQEQCCCVQAACPVRDQEELSCCETSNSSLARQPRALRLLHRPYFLIDEKRRRKRTQAAAGLAPSAMWGRF